MSVIRFEVGMIPTAMGRPRFVRATGRAYTPADTEKAIVTFASLAAPHAPPMPFQGPVAMNITFIFQVPKSWPNWKAGISEEFMHCSRPDLDNLTKLILDSMQKSGRWWRDDAQVCQLALQKRYGIRPGVLVTVEELAEPQRPHSNGQRPLVE